MKYEVEISATKYVEIEAESEMEAEEKANELPLSLNDFEWRFAVE